MDSLEIARRLHPIIRFEWLQQQVGAVFECPSNQLGPLADFDLRAKRFRRVAGFNYPNRKTITNDRARRYLCYALIDLLASGQGRREEKRGKSRK